MTASQRRRVIEALNETQRFIDKESARNPKLRPADTQKLLDFYIAHAAKLRAMLVE